MQTADSYGQQRQSPDSPASSGAAAMLSFGDIEFDLGEIDQLLLESGLDSDLDIEVQRWVASRLMIAMSLAAVIERDEDYYECILSLGEPPQTETSLMFARDLAQHACGELLRVIPAGHHEFSVLRRRLSDVESIIGLI